MHELIFRCPDFRVSERQYVMEVVLTGFLGFECRIVVDGGNRWCLTDAENKFNLLMPDIFFNKAHNSWLSLQSLPDMPLQVWAQVIRDFPEAHLVHVDLPIIAGKKDASGCWYEVFDRQNAYLGVDVFGAAFFMLTRYEELVLPNRDQHGRFPASASLAYQEGFLERPIIDEYVEILWACMKRLWPRLERKRQTYRVALTHDVDRPFAVAGVPWRKLPRRFASEVFHRRSASVASKLLSTLVIPGSTSDRIDPYNTFDWLMDQAEKRNQKATFFLMALYEGIHDCGCDLQNPRMQRLLRHVQERGHDVGLHPGYHTFQNSERLAIEAGLLFQTLESIGVSLERIGGRQHYLRWDASRTWKDYTDIGLTYDSTVYFAGSPGFRAGTCKEYPAFSVKDRIILNVVEKPLIAMEGNLVSPRYSTGQLEYILSRFRVLAKACHIVSGCFLLLWHNQWLATCWERKIFEEVLDCVFHV